MIHGRTTSECARNNYRAHSSGIPSNIRTGGVTQPHASAPPGGAARTVRVMLCVLVWRSSPARLAWTAGADARSLEAQPVTAAWMALRPSVRVTSHMYSGGALGWGADTESRVALPRICIQHGSSCLTDCRVRWHMRGHRSPKPVLKQNMLCSEVLGVATTRR